MIADFVVLHIALSPSSGVKTALRASVQHNLSKLTKIVPSDGKQICFSGIQLTR